MPRIDTTTSIIELEVKVPNIDNIMLLYDRIQVWRSSDNTTFVEITDVDDTPAILNGNITGPNWNLNGKSLVVFLNGADPITITFTKSDPYDLQTILNDINKVVKIASQIPTNTNLLRLTSNIVGLESSLQVSGNATTVLGLSTSKVNGKTHRPILTKPTWHYFFHDLSGDGPNSYYKTRFYNSITYTYSSFSVSVRGTPLQVINPSSLIKGSITLTDNLGFPIVDRKVTIVPIQPFLVDGVLLPETEIVKKTDQTGKAEFQLPKNLTVRVFIDGTLVNRLINSGTSDFDLMTSPSIGYDAFNITSTPILAPRVS